MQTLNRSVWVNQVMEKFYPDTSFLKYTRDFTELVNNNSIVIGEAGIDPEVLVNNCKFPIIINRRQDVAHDIPLDRFDTENSIVFNADQAERSYNMLESAIFGHRNQLRTKTGIRAAYAYAPVSNTDVTPVIPTTGDNDGSGKKALTVLDILNLKMSFDSQNIPMDERVLVLHPKHVRDLILYDTKTFKKIVDLVSGEPMRFAGFMMLQFTNNPTYDKTTLIKADLDAPPVPSTDTFSSFAFYSQEVMKADGEIFMYERVNDPEYRGTIIGFDKRFIALPIRNRGIGSIVSVDYPTEG